MTETLLKTPLYERHVQNGGKMVPFAGYELPVQYETGVMREHRAVREDAGLFDVSHMGEVTFRGPDALANLQNLLCNDFTTLQDGRVRYSPMLNTQGGVIDDVLVYRKAENDYLMVVNAANRHKDVAHIYIHRFGNVEIDRYFRYRMPAGPAGPQGGSDCTNHHQPDSRPVLQLHRQRNHRGHALPVKPHRVHRRGRLSSCT